MVWSDTYGTYLLMFQENKTAHNVDIRIYLFLRQGMINILFRDDLYSGLEKLNE